MREAVGVLRDVPPGPARRAALRMMLGAGRLRGGGGDADDMRPPGLVPMGERAFDLGAACPLAGQHRVHRRDGGRGCLTARMVDPDWLAMPRRLRSLRARDQPDERIEAP